MAAAVIDWWWNRYQSSTHKSLRLLRFCVVLREDLSTSGIQRSLEERDWMDHQWWKATETDGINGEPTGFEWNIFPGFTTLQLCGKVTDLLSDLGEAPETFTGRILFMSMFNDISCDRNGNKEEVLGRRFGIGQWSFIGPGSEKKWYSGEENSPQGVWDHIADEMLLEFAESGHPISVQRLHCPGVSSKAKDTENCRYMLLRIIQQLRLFLHNCFCRSAQSSRSSCKHVWRIWSSSRSIGRTWCIDGTINCSLWN